MPNRAVVTGAFGYTGRQIANKLIANGVQVRTLTNDPRANEAIEARPLDFDNTTALVESMRGAQTLYNTYWVRFNKGRTTFDAAVRNTKRLFEAAHEAGVERVVHVSISNPAKGAALGLPYFEGKAELENALTQSTLSYGIVRPTVMFGAGDVFINNMAWLLRRFPFFAIPGDGTYRIQPVHVSDVADLCIEAASQTDDTVVDAAGPEVFTFAELLQRIKVETGANAHLVRVPSILALGLAKVAGAITRDVMLTHGELRGLQAELTVSEQPSRCPTRLTSYLAAHATDFGSRYASELDRNYRSRANAATR